jgi:hypothetical protein
LTDIAIDPAGNIWVANNWHEPTKCFGDPPEGVATRGGGTGVTEFYGIAKPVLTPAIEPVRAP